MTETVDLPACQRSPSDRCRCPRHGLRHCDPHLTRRAFSTVFADGAAYHLGHELAQPSSEVSGTRGGVVVPPFDIWVSPGWLEASPIADFDDDRAYLLIG